MKYIHKPSIILAALLSTTSLASAQEAGTLEEIFTKGKTSLALRYRVELVNQEGAANKATASTLLTKLAFKTASFQGVSGMLEATNVTHVFKDNFNSTTNGNTTYPIVADPDSTEINQVYLNYTNKFVSVTGGRIGVNLDNQRFIGTVGWRQNDQTYDSVVASATPIKDLTATYGYVWNVNRINGDDHPLGDLDTNTHIFNVSYSGIKYFKITGYSYLIDLDDAAVFALSSKTFGVSLEGSAPIADGVKLGYQAEYANQSDYKDNPNDYNADYFHGGATISSHGFTVGGDYELLGSDNGASFSTPLATLHKFNGWADKFLSTPANGLQDIYGTVAYKVPEGALKGLLLKGVYHDFQSDVGNADYGSEVDLLISKALNKYFTVAAKAALYNADSFATDTKKFWFTVEAKF